MVAGAWRGGHRKGGRAVTRHATPNTMQSYPSMTLSEAATNHQTGINEQIDWSCQLIAGPPIFGRAHMAILYYKSN